MITVKDYLEWYENQKMYMILSGNFGSIPRFLFKQIEDTDDWIFNPDNWNGGDILRHGLLYFIYDGKRIDSYEIKFFRHDDQTTVFIFSSSDWYEISWYKSRGRTDIIKMNGEPIYLDDYINLCNELNITLK